MAGLTKRTLDRAKHEGPGWSWLGDDEVPGFGALVYASGAKTFALRYRTRARRQRMLKLGQFGELTVQEARDLARKEKLRVLEGADPRVERELQATGIATVGDLVDRWLEERAKPHRRSWREDERRIKSRIRPALGRISLEHLSTHRVASWHRELGKAAPLEANRCVDLLRAAWRWASRQELLRDGLKDPTAHVTRFPERGRDRWLRPEELERLVTEARKHQDRYIRAAVELLLLTGLRKGELLSAKWEDVDLERGEIRLRDTKNGEPRDGVLSSPAIAILRELPRFRGSPFLFPSPTAPRRTHRKNFKPQWSEIRTAAGLQDVTIHDLRRTAGSYMAQAGVPLQVIQQVLGHSHPGVTKLYARLASENERAAVETLAGELSRIMSNGTGPKRNGSVGNRLKATLANKDPHELAAELRTLADALER